ncbi:hypothetical protein KKG72_04710 [bacterium]|nr:hypothetical protein [bacterium]
MINGINTDISLSPSLLNIAINLFKDGIKDFSNQLLLEIILIIRQQNNELQNFLTELEVEPANLESLNYDEIDYYMDKNAIKIKRLLNTLEAFKDKSDAFKELYKSVDELYTTLVTTPVEIGFLEAKQMRLVRELDAS